MIESELTVDVLLRVHVRVREDGSVQHVSLPHDREDLCALVQKAHPKETLATIVAHATRSRLDEGKVRVTTGSEITYCDFQRCTKLHIILAYEGSTAAIKFRRDGYSLDGGAWGRRRIHDDDLKALNTKYPA